MTEILTLMTAKGGSGKTTIARGLLGAASSQGLKVGFVDTDKTENTYSWARRAYDRGHWDRAIEAYHTTDPRQLKSMCDDFLIDADLDLVIVDTPGDASAIHETMLGLSDLILCPINLTAEAVNTAVRTANFHYRQRVKVAEDEIACFRVVINRMQTTMARPYRRQLERVLEEPLMGDGSDPPAERLPLLETRIKDRAAYAEIEDEGLLDRIIAAKSSATERIGVRHLVTARDEMAALLGECRSIMKEAR